MKKRVLSAILSLCMLIGMVGLMPVTVSAEDSDTGSTTDVWDGSVASGFAGGDGTAANPYQIATGAELAYLATLINGDSVATYNEKYYELKADIDLNNVGWAPIGSGDFTNSVNIFKGNFNGNSHTIKNLRWDGTTYCREDDSTGIGLFGTIGGNVVIQNLALTGVNLNAQTTQIGGLAGYWKADSEACNGTIKNVYVSGTVEGAGTVSGFIAMPANIASGRTITFSNCVFNGMVTAAVGTAKKDNAGGFVGNGNKCAMTFTDCLNLGDISGSQYVAGLVGRNETKMTFTNCINLGKITHAENKKAGEIAATSSRTMQHTLTNTYGLKNGLAVLATNVTSDKESDRVTVEALVGANPTFTNTAFSGWTKRDGEFMLPAGVAKPVSEGGLGLSIKAYTVSWEVEGVVTQTEMLWEGARPAYKGTTPAKADEGIYQYVFTGWSPTIGVVTANTTYTAVFNKIPKEKWSDSAASSFAGGSGTAGAPYQIATAAQLAYFAQCVNAGTANNTYASAHYQLTADIDLGGKGWTPIGSGDYDNNVFTGTFDGKGHKTSNMIWDGVSYGRPANSDAIGLFGVIGASVTIQNLVIENAKIDQCVNATGILTGFWKVINKNAEATIQNVYVSGMITGTDVWNVGGLIGQLANSQNGAKIVINNCVSDCDITIKRTTGSAPGDEGNHAAGFVGNGNGISMSLTNCLNLGAVVGNDFIAGIVGRSDNGTTDITSCINMGTVTAKSGNKLGAEIIAFGTNMKGTFTIKNCYGSTEKGLVIVRDADKTNEKDRTGSIQIDGTEIIDKNNKNVIKTTCAQYATTYHNYTFKEYIGSTAKVTLDGWTNRPADIMVPTTLVDVVPRDYKGTMVKGASVRLATDSNGLRFTAEVHKDAKTFYSEVGIIIAPTKFVEAAGGDLTVEALKGDTSKYKLVKAEKLQTEGDYLTFTAALINIQEANLGEQFSARIYYKDKAGNYTYSDFSKTDNSRSIATVAQLALNDIKDEQTGEYQYVTEDGKYSPYTPEQRATLTLFAQKKNKLISLTTMTYNISYENVGDRKANIVNAIQNAVSDVDVFGLNEYNKDWKSYDLTNRFADFTCYLGKDGQKWHVSDSLIGSDRYTEGFYNPIFYRTSKFECLAGGTKWLTSTPDKVSSIEEKKDNLFNRTMTYVILKAKENGTTFLYVNTHLSTTSTEIRQQQLAYLNELIAGIKTGDYANIPVIIGGDTNEATQANMVGTNGLPASEYAVAWSIAKMKTGRATMLDKEGREYVSSGKGWTGTLTNVMLDRFVVTKDVVVKEYRTVDNAINGYYPSDHIPLKVYLTVYN